MDDDNYLNYCRKIVHLIGNVTQMGAGKDA